MSEMNDHAEEQCDDVVNMVQVLEDEELLQEDANAVLGGSDSVTCTYLKGYVPRQALYACRTCQTRDKELAGVCLACALDCHEGHDLVELYTKRHFRCDCGNSKFIDGVTVCKLCPEKSPTNADNCYNQNFGGVYCRCARPYPDPEDSIDDLMLQCSICEDWYHGRHLGWDSELPSQEEFEEVTCESCTNRCRFLRTYARHCAGMTAGHHGDGDANVSQRSGDVDSNAEVDVISNGDSMQPATSTAVATVSTDTHECHLKKLSCKEDDLSKTGAVFWCSGWRQQLCKCEECMVLYESLGVGFITDESDTIASYEERGKQMSGPSSYDKGLEALQSMNRFQQVELVQGFVELKTELKDYLKKFADNGKVVREEDIAEFFSELQAKKRLRTDHEPPQYFCK